ncbi:MFS transporter [Clostridium perfringens]|uniref:MFS transporter n=1 Tax=Clostridium perfringens TaxID=1502 RepID=UPI00016650C1|nr:MFS transporter [Clostridium perfringens]AQW23865.1 MFS transporter [Clostridium perfringens]AXH52503.1 MFS transporter [Clostridium perfringens]EDS79416.1 glucuronide permease [Clostridium perfringens C str. JGS1495]EHK2337417.1 MFS transporter [Clostridium perfringens]EIF5083204.1 MFS transporter [Clostridium perfringens]
MRDFSMKDKIGYTLGDLGCCCTEQFRAMFLTVFYTLVLKINPIHVGTILLITKVWDAINDPIIGAIIDARKAKAGKKFIPWMRAFSIPCAILMCIGFLNVSNWDYGFKLAYVLITYVLYESMYTCVNVPFGSLSSVMTDDTNHRTDLSRYRSLGGTIFMTVIVIVGPLFLYKDNQPVASNFLLLAIICACISVFCIQVTCVWCKERVEIPDVEREKINYFQVLKNISKNRALLGVIIASLVGMIAASVVNGLNTYLFKDYFGNVKLMSISGMLSTVYAIITFIGTKFVANKFGKKEWCMYGAGFAAIVYGVLFFLPIKNPIMFIAINGICYIGASGFQILIWAMVNDSIDYQELKTGTRNESIVYSTYSFFRKIAAALSASLSSFILAFIGYNVNAATQTPQVISNLWKSYTGIYSLGYVIAILSLFFIYPLTKKKTEEMLQELSIKREKTKSV